MSMKLKRFFGVILSLALVMGLMPGMSLTAHAKTYTTNQNLSTLVLGDILDTTVQSITLTNDKDKKAFYAIADSAPTTDEGYTSVEQNGSFPLPGGLKYKVIEVEELTTGATNNGWYYTFAEVKYPLWIGGKQVKSSNASNIFEDNTASYDSDTNTLKLNNYIYDGAGYEQSSGSNSTADAIFYSGSEDLIVYLTGKNQVKLSTKDSILAGYGIRVEGADLAITGNGSLTVSSTNANHPTGLKVNSLTIDEGTSVSVTAENTEKGKSIGIVANGRIKVDGSLEVQAGEATNDNYGESYGIKNNNEGSDRIKIGTKGKLTAKGGKGYLYSYGIRTIGPIEVNGTLYAEGGEAGNSHGVLCNDSFFSNGKVTAKGGKGSTASFGIDVTGDEGGSLTVESGTLTVEGGESENSVGIIAKTTISFKDGVVNASEKSVGGMGVGIVAGKSIDIGKITFFVSTGKNNAIMLLEPGTISSQINGKGWDNTQGTGNGTPITASGNLNVSGYKKVQFPETELAATVATAPTEKSDLIYTGSAQELITPGEKGEGAKELQYVLGTDSSTAPTEGWSISIPTATNAGTYHVWFKAKGNTGYTDSTPACVQVTIGKAEPVVTAPTAKTLTYTGSAQELVNAGKTTGGTMQYALGTKDAATGSYTASIPTETNVGTYYVWYKVKGDANHTDTEPASIAVTISAKEASIAYTVVSSAGTSHTIGSGKDAVITVERGNKDHREKELFTGAAMDGKAIPADGYIAEQGSLILTLKASYLDTLSEGDHKVTVSFKDGKAEAPVKIISAVKPVPKTGDGANLALWLGLLATGFAMALAVGKMKSRRSR